MFQRDNFKISPLQQDCNLAELLRVGFLCFKISEESIDITKQSGAFPSMGVLVHEMGHAALYNEFRGADWQDRQNVFVNEEQMIIDRLEKSAMQSLGFGYRTGHNTFSS